MYFDVETAVNQEIDYYNSSNYNCEEFHCAYRIEEICLLDVTDSSVWIMNKYLYGNYHQNHSL